MNNSSTVRYSKIDVFRWILQGLVGAAFIAAALAKLAGSAPMVAIFDSIGLGQWFRYFVAVYELAGGILLLWPGRSAYGALLLVLAMAGALFTHFAVIGGNWQPAAGLFVLSAVLLAWNRRQLSHR